LNAVYLESRFINNIAAGIRLLGMFSYRETIAGGRWNESRFFINGALGEW